jgi:hypothetical protein
MLIQQRIAAIFKARGLVAALRNVQLFRSGLTEAERRVLAAWGW